MANIQFNEEQEFSRPTAVPQTPRLVRLVLKTGIVSTKEQANYLLLGIAVICIVISFFVLSSGMSQNHPSPAQLEQAGKYLKTYPN